MPFTRADFLADQITPAVTQNIIFAGADETPKYAALSALGLQPASNTEVVWFDQSADEYTTAINNGADDYDAATTTLVVDSSAVFRAGDILISEATGERMQVASITNGTTIVVVRGVGSTSAAVGSVADNVVLRAISLAAGEGSDKAASRKATPTRRTNIMQIFKESIELTGTAAAMGLNTQDERARQREEAMRRIARQIERTINFGVKSTDLTDANGKVARTMGGLYEYITSNVGDPSGALTKAWLKSWARDVFASGSPQKLMFAGGIVVEQLNGLYEEQIRYAQGNTAFGIRMGMLETPYGQLQIITDRSLNGSYARDAIVVDPTNVRIRPLPGRQLQLQQNIQTNSEDTVAEQWMGEFTVEFGAEAHHARLENVQDAA